MKICKIDGAGQGAFVDDELILIHAGTGKFFSLKDTGLEIWNLLDTHNDLAAIGGELERRFDVDADACMAAVQAFADRLVEAGFARYG